MRLSRATALLAAPVLVSLLACGDDGPSGPVVDRNEVAGTYALTTLTFDPQGSLPETDLLPRLAMQGVATMLATADGQIQLQYREDTGFIRTINGSYNPEEDAIRIDFGGSREEEFFLFTRRMTFQVPENFQTLTFAGQPENGVTRARLFQLVPEWEAGGEQLLDPTPGVLRVTFTRQVG